MNSLHCLRHDLNNVLQTIADAADLLPADARCAGLAAIIHRSVEQGQRLLAEAASGESTVAAAFESARQFVADALIAGGAPALDVESRLPPHLTVPVPSPSLERVFVNLMMNAARAAPGCTIRASARQNGGALEIRVADNGPGIAPEILPELFAPGVSCSPGHQGLGLHIVESILRTHGGSIAARNRAEGGAEFVILIPGCFTSNGKKIPV